MGEIQSDMGSAQAFYLKAGSHPAESPITLRGTRIRYLDHTRALDLLERATGRASQCRAEHWRYPFKYGFAATREQWAEYMKILRQEDRGTTFIVKKMVEMEQTDPLDDDLRASHIFTQGEAGSSRHPDALPLSPVQQHVVTSSVSSSTGPVGPANKRMAADEAQGGPESKRVKDGSTENAPPEETAIEVSSERELTPVPESHARTDSSRAASVVEDEIDGAEGSEAGEEELDEVEDDPGLVLLDADFDVEGTGATVLPRQSWGRWRWW